MSKKAKITIVELAERLGVAKSTVSRALNGYPDISEAMRQRVREAAEKYGYSPNTTSRRFKRGRISVVAIVVPANDPAGDFWSVLEGAVPALARHGLDLLAAPSSEEDGSKQPYERLLAARKADAVILVGQQAHGRGAELLKMRRTPFVAIGAGDVPSRSETASLALDGIDIGNSASSLRSLTESHGYLAARCAVGHALSMQHERIAFAESGAGRSMSEARKGFEAGLDDAGQASDPRLVLNVEDEDAAVGELASLFNGAAAATAVICRSVAVAETVAKVAGSSVRDISVICLRGFDEPAPSNRVQICVEPDWKALGAWAVDTLMAQSSEGDANGMPQAPRPRFVHIAKPVSPIESEIDLGASRTGVVAPAVARRVEMPDRNAP